MYKKKGERGGWGQISKLKRIEFSLLNTASKYLNVVYSSKDHFEKNKEIKMYIVYLLDILLTIQHPGLIYTEYIYTHYLFCPVIFYQTFPVFKLIK